MLIALTFIGFKSHSVWQSKWTLGYTLQKSPFCFSFCFVFFFFLILLGKMKVCLFSVGYITECMHRKSADWRCFNKGRFSLQLIRSKVIHACLQSRRGEWKISDKRANLIVLPDERMALLCLLKEELACSPPSPTMLWQQNNFQIPQSVTDYKGHSCVGRVS